MKIAIRYYTRGGNTKKLADAIAQVTGTAAESGIALEKREFHCRGSFAALHKGKPDQKDLEEVKKFARGIIEEAQGNG